MQQPHHPQWPLAGGCLPSPAAAAAAAAAAAFGGGEGLCAVNLGGAGGASDGYKSKLDNLSDGFGGGSYLPASSSGYGNEDKDRDRGARRAYCMSKWWKGAEEEEEAEEAEAEEEASCGDPLGTFLAVGLPHLQLLSHSLELGGGGGAGGGTAKAAPPFDQPANYHNHYSGQQQENHHNACWQQLRNASTVTTTACSPFAAAYAAATATATVRSSHNKKGEEEEEEEEEEKEKEEERGKSLTGWSVEEELVNIADLPLLEEVDSIVEAVTGELHPHYHHSLQQQQPPRAVQSAAASTLNSLSPVSFPSVEDEASLDDEEQDVFNLLAGQENLLCLLDLQNTANREAATTDLQLPFYSLRLEDQKKQDEEEEEEEEEEEDKKLKRAKEKQRQLIEAVQPLSIASTISPQKGGRRSWVNNLSLKPSVKKGSKDPWFLRLSAATHSPIPTTNTSMQSSGSVSSSGSSTSNSLASSPTPTTGEPASLKETSDLSPSGRDVTGPYSFPSTPSPSEAAYPHHHPHHHMEDSTTSLLDIWAAPSSSTSAFHSDYLSHHHAPQQHPQSQQHDQQHQEMYVSTPHFAGESTSLTKGGESPSHAPSGELPHYFTGPPSLTNVTRTPPSEAYGDTHFRPYSPPTSGTSFEYGYSGDASLPEASHHEASYQINTSPILPTPLQPVKRINLFELSVNDRGITPGLSRPAFSQDSSGRFICGTEEQDISKRHRNQLIFACVDMNPSQPDSLFASLWTYTIDDHVRDIQWIDQDRALFAIANKLIYMRIGPEFSQRDMELTYFPVFHQDLIREISVSPFNKSLVLSGGFDGSVFVTDIERLCRDMATQQQRSENNNYPVHEVVSSVLWHPDDPYLASCTTDLGRYHQFDIRTERTRRSVVIDTGRPELYCHAYKNAYEVIFGFGTGHLQLFDTRTQQTVATWKDPFQKQIGEIKLQPGYPENFVTFGEAEVTFWKQSGRDIQFWAHHCLLPSTSQPLPFYKTSGEFLYASNYLAVTDSLGTLSWYHVPM